MKTLKLFYHDGTIQTVTPQQDATSKNRFAGDWGKLADTLARKRYPTLDADRCPNGRLFIKMEIN